MSTEKDFTQEEKVNENLFQYGKEMETLIKTLSQCSQGDKGPTRERQDQTIKEGFEVTKHHGSEKSKGSKLNPVPSGDKDPQRSSDLSIQAAQPSPPPSREIDIDNDSLAKLPSTSGQPPSPSSQVGSTLEQLPPPSSQSDSQCGDVVERVEVANPQTNNLEDTTANKCSCCDTEYQKELCEEILKSDPLRGIGDYQIYFTKLYDDFCDKIRKLGILDKTETEFMALDNDYERIQYVSRFEDVKNLSISTYNSKSETYADALEEEYNNCCHESDKSIQTRGLQIINRCIQLTPGTNKKLLGIRLMKRAWINILLTKFDEAREDAHESLKYHTDPSVMWNSFEILGHCYSKRNDNSTAEHFFKEAITGLRQSNIDKETKAAATVRISSVYKYVKGRKDMGGSNKNQAEDLVTPPISYGINATLKCATDAVQVKVKKETGRGLYARREIQPGDVIIVEKPYVSALNRENFETHCNYCYKRFKSPIPCDTCSRVWFCSEECLKAKENLHSSECHVLNLLYEESIGSMGIIVFRILLQLTWEKVKSLRNSKKIDTKLPDSDQLHAEFKMKEKYSTDDYLTTYKLVTNSRKRKFGDIFKRTITAVYIKQCLKVVNFFKEDNVSFDDEIFVASLILRHLQNSSCNAYGIIEFIVQESCMDVDILELGGGIYPTISLINHSCNPNVFRYSSGKDCIVRATKLIGKGEQLLDNYCSLYDMLGRESRRDVLTTQYKFHCDCIACKENWPLYEKNKVYMRLACPEENCDQIVEYDGKEKMNCPSCGFNRKHKNLMTEVKDRIKEYKQGVKSLKDGHRDKATVTIKGFQMYADKNIIPPSKCLTECQEIYKRCFLLQGNVFESNRK